MCFLASNIFENVIGDIENKEWKNVLKELIPDVIELEERWIMPGYKGGEFPVAENYQRGF